MKTRYIKEEIGNKKYKYGYVYGKPYTDVKQKNKILLNLENSSISLIIIYKTG